MEYLKVKDWDTWQSYRKDRGMPSWIKVHKSLMTSHKWAILSDAEKGQLLSIWIAASDNNGRVPNDSRILMKICGLDNPPDLQKLMDIGLLEEWVAAGCQAVTKRLPHDNPLADVVTPGGGQSDAPEKRRGEEKREETEDAVNKSPDHSHKGSNPDETVQQQRLRQVIDEKRNQLIELTTVTAENFTVVAEHCVAHYRTRKIGANPYATALAWFKRERGSPKSRAGSKDVLGEIDRLLDEETDDKRMQRGRSAEVDSRNRLGRKNGAENDSSVGTVEPAKNAGQRHASSYG